ncbi:BQ5605_C007g04499 [Microbotryum silenes-dioicae]|uniref:BQ5605_C007g04499 protein n=1 Tax=Microbotryum silenes-dioicae TaxID=796604 RepID=A0A2X0MUB4_9BASI|nr:BQ5605_C007g04499 [Microbotryum silenes-dioicae]
MRRTTRKSPAAAGNALIRGRGRLASRGRGGGRCRYLLLAVFAQSIIPTAATTIHVSLLGVVVFSPFPPRLLRRLPQPPSSPRSALRTMSQTRANGTSTSHTTMTSSLNTKNHAVVGAVRNKRKGIPSRAPRSATTTSTGASSSSSSSSSASSSSSSSTSATPRVHNTVNVSALLRALLRESERSGYHLDLPRYVAPILPTSSAAAAAASSASAHSRPKKERDILAASDPNYGRGKRAASQALRDDHHGLTVSSTSTKKQREASPVVGGHSLRRQPSQSALALARSTEPASSSNSTATPTGPAASNGVQASKSMARASSLGPAHQQHHPHHHHHHPYARAANGNGLIVSEALPAHSSPLAKGWVTPPETHGASAVPTPTTLAATTAATTSTTSHDTVAGVSGRERGAPKALQ